MLMIKNYTIHESDIVSEEINNEIVVINLETGFYYSLNKIASVIWNLISKRIPHKQILEYIILNNAVKEEIAQKDLDELLSKLIKERLIFHNNSTIEEKDIKDFEINNEIIQKKIKYQQPYIRKHLDMQELLKMDPIHEVTDLGWPYKKV